jgi:hypothetical protein
MSDELSILALSFRLISRPEARDFQLFSCSPNILRVYNRVFRERHGKWMLLLKWTKPAELEARSIEIQKKSTRPIDPFQI